jgi:hypothetical protein
VIGVMLAIQLLLLHQISEIGPPKTPSFAIMLSPHEEDGRSHRASHANSHGLRIRKLDLARPFKALQNLSSASIKPVESR